MLVNHQTIESFIASHRNGTFGVCIVSITVPSLTGGKKCPFLGRLFKVTYTKNAILGISYEASIKGAEQRSGIEVGTFEAAGLPWGAWSDYPYIIEHKDTKYLRLFQKKVTKTTSCYYLDGCLVDKDSEVFAEISAYLTKKAVSKKQEDAGIDAAEQVKPLTYKFDSICYLMQSGKGYVKNIGIELDTDIIDVIFKNMG